MITLVWLSIFGVDASRMFPDHLENTIRIAAYVLACVLAYWPGNWLIRKVIRKWKPDYEDTNENLGAMIGTLERILTIIFVGVGSYAAVGFVVAMKSIARYELLKEKEFAEYFLAGTMLSLLVALILGLLVVRIFGNL